MELSLYRVRKKQTIGESVFKSLLTGLNAAERKEAVQGMVRFWKSPLGQEIRRSPKCYPELPFIYKTPYGLLKGQIDLVYQKSPGHWVILDYKTNQIAKNQVEKAAEEYEFQLGLYSLVFGDLTGEIPAQGALYFMSPNETHSFNYTPAAIKAIRERLLAVFQTIV